MDQYKSNTANEKFCLELEWIYGYHGQQCRNNVYYSCCCTGEIIYCVATVGIVLNLIENKQKFYLGHHKEITCLAQNQAKNVVATGQLGPNGYVCIWSPETMETICILKNGHQNGVSALDFDDEGNRLVSIGLEDNPSVNVWDWSNGTILKSYRDTGSRILFVKFVPLSNFTFVTCGLKHTKFWKLCGNDLDVENGQYKESSVKQTMLCVAFGTTTTTTTTTNGVAYTGSLSGDIYVWKNHVLSSVIKDVHPGGLITIYRTWDLSYITGGKDGCIQLWDPQFKPMSRIDLTVTMDRGLVIRSVHSHQRSPDKVLVGTNQNQILEVSTLGYHDVTYIMQGHHDDSLVAMATHPHRHLFVTGSGDSILRLWNMDAKTQVAQINTNSRILSCDFSPSGSHIAVSMQNGAIFIIRIINQDLSETHFIQEKPENKGLVKYSPDGKKLVSTDQNGGITLFDILEGYRNVGRWVTSNGAPIVTLDWSTDGHYLKVNDNSKGCHLFRVQDGLHVQGDKTGLQWSTWTGIVGPEVRGLWSKYKETCDVVTTDVDFDRNIMVTGSNDGKIGFTGYPSFASGATRKSYKRHSSSVSNVRFTYDKSHVISIGQSDYAICQWKCHYTTGHQHFHHNIVETDRFSENDEKSDELEDQEEEMDSDVEAQLQLSYTSEYTKEQVKTANHKFISEITDIRGRGRRKIPTEGLQLQFAIGYRGFDCRNNLYVTKFGTIVYHVAAVGITLNRNNCSQKFYVRHTNDILCLAIHPHKDLIATGQAGHEPSIHVWTSQTLRTVSILKWNQQTVGIGAIEFSSDGQRIVSVGLDDKHTVVVWNWKTGEQLATNWGHSQKIFTVKSSPYDNYEFATVGINHLKFWTLRGNGFISKKPEKNKLETMLSISYGKTSQIQLSGGSSGTIYVWDRGTILIRTIQRVHQGPIFCLQSSENRGFVTGGKDGTVQLWDDHMERCLKIYYISKSYVVSGGQMVYDRPSVRAIYSAYDTIIVGTIDGEILELDKIGNIQILIQGQGRGKLRSLDVHPQRHQTVTLSEDKTLRIWDLQTHQMLSYKSLANTGTCVTYSLDSKFLAVGFNEGSCILLNAETLHTIHEIHQRKGKISFLKFSPSNSLLAIGFREMVIDVYNVVSWKWISVCNSGLTGSVDHMDWSTDDKLLRVNTPNGNLLIYEASSGTLQNIQSNQVKWYSWTCGSGLNWEPITNMSDDCAVTSTCRSSDEKLLSVCDRYGFLRLAQFPLMIENPKCKWYIGHGHKVTDAKWSYNGQLLISGNETDGGILLWNRSTQITERKVNFPDSDESDSDDLEDDFDNHVANEIKASKTLKEQKLHSRVPIKDSETSETHLRQFKTKSFIKEGDGETNFVRSFVLDHIIGYNGNGSRNNIHHIKEGQEIVYPSGFVAIVMNTITGNQSFYESHTDTITCLATNDHHQFCGTVATGQLQGNPAIRIWSSVTLQTISLLNEHHENGVAALDFSTTGKVLVSIGLDTDHTITVWKWENGHVVARIRGSSNPILAVKFRPDNGQQFVTVGQRHIVFWKITGNQLVNQKGIMCPNNNDGQSELVSTKTMLSITFGKNDVTYTGAANGNVFVWKTYFLHRVIIKAHMGPIYVMHLSLRDGLITTGSKEKLGASLEDACIKLWDPEMKRCRPFLVRNHIGDIIVKSVSRCKGKIVVGTDDNLIYEIIEKTGFVREVSQAHSAGGGGGGGIEGLALHQSRSLVATTGGDRTLRIWDISNRRIKHRFELDSIGHSVHFSLDGEIIAIGQQSGQFLLLNSGNLKILTKRRDTNYTINDLKISSCGRYLAVASVKSDVNIYCISQGWNITRVGYWHGPENHRVTVHFSTDSKFLMLTNEDNDGTILTVPDGCLLYDTIIGGPQFPQFYNLGSFHYKSTEIQNEEFTEDTKLTISCFVKSNHHKLTITRNTNAKTKMTKSSKHGIKVQSDKCHFATHPISKIGFSYDEKHIVTTCANDYRWRASSVYYVL